MLTPDYLTKVRLHQSQLTLTIS